MTTKRDIIFTLGTLFIVLLVGFGIGRAVYNDLTIVTGGINHNVQEDFSEGITVDGEEIISGTGTIHGRILATTSPASFPSFGSSTLPGCIIMGDTDATAVSYMTVLDGTLTTTGGAAGQFTVPEDCQ